MASFHADLVRTPLGWAGIAFTDQGICRLILPRIQKQTVQRELASHLAAVLHYRRKAALCSPHPDERGLEMVSRKASELLQKYFSGEQVLFDLPLDLSYYTIFQQSVWRTAGRIPYGETRSYAWVAGRIGKPRAARAVGQALGANPVPIIVP